MHGGLSFSLFLCVTLPLSALCTVSIEHFLWVLVPFRENMILLEELTHRYYLWIWKLDISEVTLHPLYLILYNVERRFVYQQQISLKSWWPWLIHLKHKLLKPVLQHKPLLHLSFCKLSVFQTVIFNHNMVKYAASVPAVWQTRLRLVCWSEIALGLVR